ncbi:MAG: alpha-L-fucosidase [Bacteroidales bacterium]|nr:alpha-L-fucosidase [Bacteroidales bacterium]
MRRFAFSFLLLAAACSALAPEPCGPVPSASQMEWQKMEMNMFCHFGPNTFSGLEWGDGTEPEDLFAPTALDCRQWARTAAAAGMKGIIITAKHHDGFCLWPNPESTHTVAASPWREGRGDVLRELSDACREYGLKFGVYISPWDRFDPDYGSPAYNEKYARTLRSVHDGRYGPVFEQWFDGACGEGPDGRRQEYDWPLFHATVRELSPDAVMFSDVGPGCRWVGNERGSAGETNWSTLSPEGFAPGRQAPPVDTLRQGNKYGTQWIPAETDVSLRPGWFWRQGEEPKSVDELMRIYLESVGRNSLLLLNVPPDTRGRIPEADSLRLMEWKARLDREFRVNLALGASVGGTPARARRFRGSNLVDGDFDTFWAPDDGVTSPVLELSLPAPTRFDRVVLQEYIPLGQRVAEFRVEARSAGAWQEIAAGTTIGYKRILPVGPLEADALRITVCSAKACPVLSEVALYCSCGD